MKLGSLEAARKLFDQMPVKDSITWNNMVGGYAGSGMMEDDRVLFDRMCMEMKDLITMNAMVDGFAKECRYEEVLELFRELELVKIKPM